MQRDLDPMICSGMEIPWYAVIMQWNRDLRYAMQWEQVPRDEICSGIKIPYMKCNAMGLRSHDMKRDRSLDMLWVKEPCDEICRGMKIPDVQCNAMGLRSHDMKWDGDPLICSDHAMRLRSQICKAVGVKSLRWDMQWDKDPWYAMQCNAMGLRSHDMKRDRSLDML